RCGPEGDPRPHRGPDGVILCTRRALALGAALAALGAAGYWAAWALPAMLVADVVLLAGVWLDGRWAPRPRAPGLEIVRDAPPALSVGRGGEVAYRWANRSGRRARLRVREVRPELLGGVQPPRALTVPPRGERRETLAVVPVRRGRARGGDGSGEGGFVVDSVGPLGLGLRRETVPLPWEVTVYPPIVPRRLRAALELAYAAAQHDDNVGVMAFADGVKHYVAPQRGRVGLKRALDVLAVLEPVLVEPDYPGAFRYLAARSRKRALTVLFTDVIDR